MIDDATLKTDRSIHHENLLLVGDISDAVFVTSVLYLRKKMLVLRKRFVVEG